MPEGYYVALSIAKRKWFYYIKYGNKKYKIIAQENYRKAESIKKRFFRFFINLLYVSSFTNQISEYLSNSII